MFLKVDKKINHASSVTHTQKKPTHLGGLYPAWQVFVKNPGRKQKGAGNPSKKQKKDKPLLGFWSSQRVRDGRGSN